MNDITKNLINCLLAGVLVFVGACSTGDITSKSILLSFMVSLGVGVTQFKQYWENKIINKPIKRKKKVTILFNFLNL